MLYRTNQWLNGRAVLARLAGKWTLPGLSIVVLLAASGLLAPRVHAAPLGSDLVESTARLFEAEHLVEFVSDSSTSLNDYLAYAALHSPALRQAFYRWKAALSRSGYAGALPDPMISYGYFIKNVETRTGPQNQRLSLKQTIPWFGTLGAKKAMATEGANSAYRRYEAEKLRLFYSVRSAYYSLYYLGRDIALTQDNLALLKFWEAVARTRYRVALSSHPDIIKAQVELGRLEDRLLTLQHQVEPASSRLRASVNLSDSVIISVPQTLQVDETVRQSDAVLILALESNPDLNSIQHQIKREEAASRLAGKASLPGFTLGIDYIETGEALNPAMLDSGKDPLIFGVGINLPVWFGKNKAKRQEAAANLRAAEYGYADAKNKLRAMIDEVVFQHADALRRSRLYRDGLIPKAEQALNASYTAYQAAETDFLNVLDAQRQLLAFQLQLEQAIVHASTRRAEIEMITGVELHQTQNQPMERNNTNETS